MSTDRLFKTDSGLWVIQHANPDLHMIGEALPVPTLVNALDGSALVGSSPKPAREDHKHDIGTLTSITISGLAVVEYLKVNSPSYFHLRNSTTWTIANNTMVELSWDTEISDDNNLHSAGNYITVDQDGYWAFSASATTDNAAAVGPRILTLVIDQDLTSNNSNNYRGSCRMVNNANYGTVAASVPMVYLTAGQKVSVYAYQSTSASRTWSIAGRIELSHFIGGLLFRG